MDDWDEKAICRALYLCSASADEGLAHDIVVVICAGGHAPVLSLPLPTPLIHVLQKLLRLPKALVRGSVHMRLREQLPQAVWIFQLHCVPIL